jgi:hypothetical protein
MAKTLYNIEKDIRTDVETKKSKFLFWNFSMKTFNMTYLFHFTFTFTVYSSVHLAKNLLQEPNVVVFLSERVCKDPLEELYFSRQHAAGG